MFIKGYSQFAMNVGQKPQSDMRSEKWEVGIEKWEVRSYIMMKV